MFLSKIWFILIALIAAVAVTFALVTPRPAMQKLAALEGQRLDRAQYAAEQMFKVDAHKWIDRVSKLGRDAIISESLDSASRGSGEYTVIHRTIQDRFRTLIPDLSSGGIDSLVAIDNKGRVIARVGDNDKEYGDYIGGAEVVADALRGYLSDDVWGIGGKLQRVAAAPVLSKNRDRIVGAIYVSAETGPALVERLKTNLNVDIALMLRGKVIASSRPGGDLDTLPEIVSQHTKEIETVKRTEPIPLDAGRQKLLAVVAPFPGQAGEQQAYYALIGVRPADTDLFSLLSATTSDDLKWGHFPWLQLAGGVIAMIGIGLFLQRVEVESPLRRLRREVQRMASGDVHKINDIKYGGHIGGLARDVNAAVERFTHAPSAPSETAGKDLGAILGPSGGSTFDLPAPEPAFTAPPPSGFAPPPPPPPPSFPPPTPAIPSFAPPPIPSFSSPAPSFPPPAPFSASSFGLGGGGLGAAESTAPEPPLPLGIKPAPWSQVPSRAMDDGEGAGAGAAENDATRVVPYDAQDEEDAHFSNVFDEFIEKKRQCGEPIGNMTRDKFLQKLRDNKAALVSKHHCRTVRFTVYAKDGKAALKATPVRD
jgi:hypothetical protein